MSCEMGGEGPNTSLIPNTHTLGSPWPTHHRPLRHQPLFWYVIYIPLINYRKHGAVWRKMQVFIYIYIYKIEHIFESFGIIILFKKNIK